MAHTSKPTKNPADRTQFALEQRIIPGANRVYRKRNIDCAVPSPQKNSGMKPIVDTAITHVRIWGACWRLDSSHPGQDMLAVERLRSCGRTSIPYLRLASRLHAAPRLQFSAAVALHALGDPRGLELLIEALRWRTASSPHLTREIENALIAIGSPDAGAALLELWKNLQTTGWRHHEILAAICRVWVALEDPRALEALAPRAEDLPELFEETVPQFGNAAVEMLRPMLADPQPHRRRLALFTLRRVTGAQSFAALTPLLYDTDPTIRSEVPHALEVVGGRFLAVEAIKAAIEAGFSSQEAVEKLWVVGRNADPITMAIVDRWNRDDGQARHDTEGAVQAALHVLTNSIIATEILVRVLCDLLERGPGPRLTPPIVQILGARCRKNDSHASRIRASLLPILADPNAECRATAAATLEQTGESLGTHFLMLLEECRPQAHWLEKIEAALRDGAEAAQLMNQISNWFSRAAREGLLKAASDGARNGMGWDERLRSLLGDFLCNALDALQAAETSAKAHEAATLCLTGLRASGRLGKPMAPVLQRQVVRALSARCDPRAAPQTSHVDTAALVRDAAAEALLTHYGPHSFPLFLDALYRRPLGLQGSSIIALGRLGDPRALPHLQSIQDEAGHPCGGTAAGAIAEIRQTNPEIMLLLRGSATPPAPMATLLRPADTRPSTTAPEEMLRPANRERTRDPTE